MIECSRVVSCCAAAMSSSSCADSLRDRPVAPAARTATAERPGSGCSRSSASGRRCQASTPSSCARSRSPARRLMRIIGRPPSAARGRRRPPPSASAARRRRRRASAASKRDLLERIEHLDRRAEPLLRAPAAKPSTRDAPPLSTIRSMRSEAAVALKKSNVFWISSSTFSVIACSTGCTSSNVTPSTGWPFLAARRSRTAGSAPSAPLRCRRCRRSRCRG